jgi:hypothetical protein
MTTTKDDNKPLNEIMPYLREISERLRANHASVMVGAGFSKNTDQINSKKHFPSWNELGDLFFEKLFGEKPNVTEKAYMDILKLAGEVEATFGRPALDNIIKSHIPDKDFQPSDLHKSLLSLPWTDVFTTNYDTLLERAAENVLEFRYEPIVNKEDLIWSTKPRIIKLHGSFPSKRPFIITEEDYRTYPHKFAPFVNTVQQSLLENTLCLIGFSGDDPNFLHWIGWIRDNLGKDNSPKIFLIGIFSLSKGQIRLLEDRNIIPIDISCISKDYHKAFKGLFDKLQQIIEEESLKWPKENYINFEPTSDKFISQVQNAIITWQETRQKYPKWLILPNKYRIELRQNTDESVIYNLEKVDSPLDIMILYEFNWRMKKSLYPFINEWDDLYTTVIKKYNPFPDFLNMDSGITPLKNSGMDWNNIRSYWIDLQFSLLAFYRQKNDGDAWSKLFNKLQMIELEFSPEQKAEFHYERCLDKLFSLNISELKKELKLWEDDPSLPFWEAKKAGLLAELGDIHTAETILESSLKTIREKILLSPDIDDYLIVSQEAYILQLLDYVKGSIRYFQREYTLENEEKKEYRKRWDMLIKFECDPWGELDLFEAELKLKQSPFTKTEISFGFDIGNQQITRHWGADWYTINSYSFLKYMEEIGVPFRLTGITFGKNAATNAFERISMYSPIWALITLIRIGDEKNAEKIFNRKNLSGYSQEYCDDLVLEFLKTLETSRTEIEKADSHSINTFAINLSNVLPYILSRLCTKNSYDVKIKMLEFLRCAYSSEQREKYNGLDVLANYLIRSFSETEQYNLIPEFLSFPIIPDTLQKKYPDPFSFIQPEEINTHSILKIKHQKIEEMIESMNSDDKRRKAISRMVILWRYQLLSKEQILKFSQVLWGKVNSDGFPTDTNYYYFSFLWLPHPENVDPKSIFNKYIEKNNFFAQSLSGESGILITRGHDHFSYNITGTYNKHISYKWTEGDLVDLLDKIYIWWENDRYFLLDNKGDDFSSTADEFKARFNNMVSIFICVFQPNIDLLTEDSKNKIKKILVELTEYKFYDMAAKASFLKLFPEFEDKLIDDIKHGLSSKSENNISDALNGIIVLARQNYEKLNDIISDIGQLIKNRSDVGLYRFTSIMTSIINEFSWYINNDILKMVNFGLGQLLEETNISDKDTEEKIHGKLKNRIYGIKLVIAIKNYYNSKNMESPEYIKEWENICLSKDEFCEVINTWKNNC